jgi:hypothetical protein
MSKDQPKAVRIDSWTFDGSIPSRRSGAPLLGIFLIVFGLLLAAGQLFTWAQQGTAAFFIAIGVALVVMGLRDRSDLALYAGVFIAAIALSDLLSGAGVIHGEGWGTLLVGAGLLVAALLRSSPGHRIGWTIGLGLLLLLWGASQVVATNADLPADRLIGPLLIVLLGVYIVGRRIGVGSH